MNWKWSFLNNITNHLKLSRNNLIFLFFLGYIFLISVLNQRQELANNLSAIFVLSSVIAILFNRKLIRSAPPLVFIYILLTIVITIGSVHFIFRDDYYSSIVLISSLFPYTLVIMSYYMLRKYEFCLENYLWCFFLLFIVACTMTYTNALMFEQIVERQGRTNWTNLVGAIFPFFFLFKNRLIQIICISIGIVFISIGLKRTGIIVGLSCLSIYLVFFEMPKNKFFSIFIRLGQVLSVLIVCLYIFSLDFFDKAFSRLSLLSSDGGAGRDQLIIQSVSAFQELPIVMKFLGGGYQYFYIVNGHSLSSHNDFFDILLSYGVIASILYLSIIFRVLYLSFFLWGSTYGKFAISVFISLVIYSNSSSAHHYYYFFTPLFIAIAYMEYLFVKNNIQNRNKKVEND